MSKPKKPKTQTVRIGNEICEIVRGQELDTRTLLAKKVYKALGLNKPIVPLAAKERADAVVDMVFQDYVDIATYEDARRGWSDASTNEHVANCRIAELESALSDLLMAKREKDKHGKTERYFMYRAAGWIGAEAAMDGKV